MQKQTETNVAISVSWLFADCLHGDCQPAIPDKTVETRLNFPIGVLLPPLPPSQQCCFRLFLPLKAIIGVKATTLNEGGGEASKLFMKLA